MSREKFFLMLPLPMPLHGERAGVRGSRLFELGAAPTLALSP